MSVQFINVKRLFTPKGDQAVVRRNMKKTSKLINLKSLI